MNFINGNIYRIKNQYYPNHALNVYGTNAASTGRNVCLYYNTPSDIMQRWVLKTYGDGFQLCSAVNNSYVLDCSDGSLTNSYKNNAHLCKFSPKSAADNTVEFIEVSDDLYKIYLPGKNLYLTATNINRLNGLSASTIKTATALTGGTGGQSNVYWAAEATSSLATQKQCWTVELYSGSSSGGGETGTVIGVIVPNGTYDESQTQQEYPWIDGNYNISKDKFHSSGCSAMSATYAARIVKNNVNINPENLFADGIFDSSDGYPNANWGTSETYGITYTKKSKGRSDSAILADIYNQLSAGKPIIIVLADKKVSYSYTHFVLAYELASGTTSGNITKSKVKILDPWTTKNTTLEQATNYTTKWAALLNTVFVS